MSGGKDAGGGDGGHTLCVPEAPMSYGTDLIMPTCFAFSCKKRVISHQQHILFFN